MENSTGLKSSLKTRHIVMLSLGGAIGSGLFLGSGKVIAQAGPSVLLSYILAGLTLYVVMYGVGKMSSIKMNIRLEWPELLLLLLGTTGRILRTGFTGQLGWPS